MTKCLVVGHLVGGAHHADQWHRHPAAAVVELALVEQRQQGVEDGRIGLEHFVEESHLRRGQEAVGETFVSVVLQRPERERAEQFLGHGKARQQPLEIARAGKHAVQAPRQFAYIARKIAVDYLKARSAKEVFVHLAYAIGRAEPLEATVTIDGKQEVVGGYDLTPKGIIELLNLKKPIYEQTARYGHFGHDFSWEQ